MTANLFREEAIEHQKTSWLGGIALAQPIGIRAIATIAICLAVALIMLFTFGEYSRKARVVGQLVPDRGLIAIVAPAGGVVIDRRVDEGANVRAGDVIAVVSGERVSSDGATQADIAMRIASRRASIEADIERLARIDREQTDGARARLATARAEFAEVTAAAAAQAERVKLASDTLARFEELSRDGHVSKLQMQQQREALLEQRTRSSTLAQSRLALSREIERLEQDLVELPLRTANQRSALQRELALIGQEAAENAARRDQVIKAPADGVVGALLVLPGQAVQAGQVIANVVPAGSRLEAHVYAPSRSIAFLERGDDVRLRYQAFPFQKFGHQHGRIARVSRNALTPVELRTLGIGEDTDVMYRVVVELDRQAVAAYGGEEALKPGMALEADVLLERRRLWEWVLEPLFAAAARV
jgi:membrane fusion protein